MGGVPAGNEGVELPEPETDEYDGIIIGYVGKPKGKFSIFPSVLPAGAFPCHTTVLLVAGLLDVYFERGLYDPAVK